ncbi:MAG: RsbRD N-terminal domain-containing protein [Archaeoglobaceae archaeon]
MRKSEILQRWVEEILKHYPIRVQEVTGYVSEAAEKILDGILNAYSAGEFSEGFEDAVDDLMRFLATERNYKPSESVGLLFELYEMLKREMGLDEGEQLRMLNVMIAASLKAFDRYMSCREKLYELRVKEKDKELEALRKVVFYHEKFKS